MITSFCLTLAFSGAVIHDGRTGEEASVDAVVNDLATRDVVFLGEFHNHLEIHEVHWRLLEGLRELRPDLVISMEMFERDTQGLVTDYLLGRISEDMFLASARPWPKYSKHYRPVVEFAREHGLDLLAANVPRPLAAELATSDQAFRPGAYTSRTIHAPRESAYYDNFVSVIGSHVGADNLEQINRMYIAQCLKDDTMAEALADYRALHGHRQPLIVHVCGAFHSDFGLGTVRRVLRRDPAVRVGITSAFRTSEEDPWDFERHRGRADYVVVVASAENDTEEEGSSDDGTPSSPEGSQDDGGQETHS